MMDRNRKNRSTSFLAHMCHAKDSASFATNEVELLKVAITKVRVRELNGIETDRKVGCSWQRHSG